MVSRVQILGAEGFKKLKGHFKEKEVFESLSGLFGDKALGLVGFFSALWHPC